MWENNLSVWFKSCEVVRGSKGLLNIRQIKRQKKRIWFVYGAINLSHLLKGTNQGVSHFHTSSTIWKSWVIIVCGLLFCLPSLRSVLFHVFSSLAWEHIGGSTETLTRPTPQEMKSCSKEHENMGQHRKWSLMKRNGDFPKLERRFGELGEHSTPRPLHVYSGYRSPRSYLSPDKADLRRP